MNGPTAYLDASQTAWRTPLGHDVSAVMERLDRGACAYEPLGLPGYAVRDCARIAGEPPIRRYHRFVKRIGLWGIEAAADAIERAELRPSDRTGVYVGYGGLRPDWDETLPRLEHQSDGGAWEGGLKDFHPFWMLNHLSNNAHSIVATKFGLTGDGATYGGTNSGIVAVEAAIDALALGLVDTAVVLAYDTLIQPEVLVEWPLDPKTADWVPGEAAAAVVLRRRAALGLAAVRAASEADRCGEQPGHDEFTAGIGHVGAAHGLLHLIAASWRGVAMSFTHRCAPGLVATIECAP